MAGKKLELGHTGRAVAENVARLRAEENYTDLSKRLGKLGRDIPALALRRIEDGTRRVDADDLVALAAALGVSPVTLLMPGGESRYVTAADTEFSRETLWEWLIAEWPFPGQGLMEFFSKALPPWKLAAVERRIAQRHGADSVAELERPFTIRLEGAGDGDD